MQTAIASCPDCRADHSPGACREVQALRNRLAHTPDESLARRFGIPCETVGCNANATKRVVVIGSSGLVIADRFACEAHTQLDMQHPYELAIWAV